MADATGFLQAGLCCQVSMTGRRATGFVFAGEALSGNATLGIRMVTTNYPALFILVAATILCYYPITRELNQQIADELEASQGLQIGGGGGYAGTFPARLIALTTLFPKQASGAF